MNYKTPEIACSNGPVLCTSWPVQNIDTIRKNKRGNVCGACRASLQFCSVQRVDMKINGNIGHRTCIYNPYKVC